MSKFAHVSDNSLFSHAAPENPSWHLQAPVSLLQEPTPPHSAWTECTESMPAVGPNHWRDFGHSPAKVSVEVGCSKVATDLLSSLLTLSTV